MHTENKLIIQTRSETKKRSPPREISDADSDPRKWRVFPFIGMPDSLSLFLSPCHSFLSTFLPGPKF